MTNHPNRARKPEATTTSATEGRAKLEAAGVILDIDATPEAAPAEGRTRHYKAVFADGHIETRASISTGKTFFACFRHPRYIINHSWCSRRDLIPPGAVWAPAEVITAAEYRAIKLAARKGSAPA